MSDELGQKIRRLRRSKGLGQKELGHAVGRTEGWVSKLEAGKIDAPSFRVMIGLAQKLDVPVEELTGGPIPEGALEDIPVVGPVLATSAVDEEIRRLAEVGRRVLQVVQEEAPAFLIPTERVKYIEDDPVEEMVELPILDSLAASQLGTSGRQIEETIAVPRRIADRAREPRVIRIAGDCLARRGLITGDHIVIDCANMEPREGQIVAFRFKGEEAVKVYHQNGNTIELRPTMPDYPTIRVRPHEVADLDVIGVMVGAMLTAPRE